jgi:hypothetical protein
MSCQVRKRDKYYGVRLTGRDSFPKLFSPILVKQFGKKVKFHIVTLRGIHIIFNSLPLMLLSTQLRGAHLIQ